MSNFPTSFCTPELTSIDTSTNSWFSNIKNLIPTTYQTYLYDSLGIEQTTNPPVNLENFYQWWSNNINVETWATVVNTNSSNDEDVCGYFRDYNITIMKIFFCNNTPGEIFQPKLEGSNIAYYTQLNNIHYFFKNQGGVGMGYCNQQGNNNPPFLQNFCTSITPDGQDTGQFISSNTKIFRWCGCYAQQSQLSKDFTQDFTNVQKLACNPLCNYFDSIPIYQPMETGTEYQPVQCIETICVIDKVSIRSVDSQGNINFNQICQGCRTEGGNCLCIIDTSVKGILDKIITDEGGTQDPASFKQACAGAQCYYVNDQGVYIQTECNPASAASTNQNPFSNYQNDGFIQDISSEDKLNSDDYFGMFFIIVAMIIILILSLIGLHEFKTKIKDQQKVTKTVKPPMSFVLNPTYKPGSVNAYNKTKYAPSN